MHILLLTNIIYVKKNENLLFEACIIFQKFSKIILLFYDILFGLKKNELLLMKKVTVWHIYYEIRWWESRMVVFTLKICSLAVFVLQVN